MKMKNLLTSFIAVMLVGGIVLGLLNDNKTSVYKKRIGDASYDAKGMQEWFWNRRANLQTGQMDYNYIAKVTKEMEAYNSMKGTNDFPLSWIEMGPDKVGGRTRSILIDKNNTNTLYAGSVSGGLWKSTNAGGSWKKVNSGASNLVISSIAQTDNGDIYYGTGEPGGSWLATGFRGEGIWKSTDGGNTFEQLTSTTNFTFVYKMVTNENNVYAATNKGLYRSTDNGDSWTKLHTSNKAVDVAIGKDGTIYTVISGKAYKSATGEPNSFTEMTDIPNVGNNGRMVFATAPSNSNYVYCSAAYITNNNPFGADYLDFNVYKSTDKGETWTSIRGEYTENFQPFKHQAVYDNIIAVYPDNENKILLGGIELYTWNNISNAWEKVSNWIGNHDVNSISIYLHADLHEIVFDPNYTTNKRIYFGNDGGVFVSNDGAVTYTSLNLKYNVTQFYDIGFGPKGEIIAGSQDNGTQYNSLEGNNKQRTTEILGGDGFDCAISKLNNDIKFATIYHGDLYRIVGNDRQEMLEENTTNNFHTNIALWESYYDDESIDSIYYAFTDSVKEYIPSGDTVIKVLWQRGDTIIGKSACGLKPIQHILTEDDWTSPIDTIFKTDQIVKIWDYYQSAIAISLSTGVWVSSLADNLGISGVNEYRFIKIIKNSDINGGHPENLAWSSDGDILYFSVGTKAYRISGIKFARELQYANIMRKNITVYNADKIKLQLIGNFGNKVTYISVDPNVSNNIIVTTGSYSIGDHIFYSTNAAVTNSSTTSANFTAIQGTLPEIPAYSSLIAWNDSRKAVVGTEFGIYTTDDLTADPVTWVLQDDGLPSVATYSLKQERFVNDWKTGVENHGFIYAATHGRGAFRSESNAGPVSVPEMPNANKSNISKINIYPNPVSSIGNIYINLEKPSIYTISIYNLSGQQVYNSKYNGVRGENTIQFSVDGLNSGVYFVKVSDANNSEIKKIVVK